MIQALSSTFVAGIGFFAWGIASASLISTVPTEDWIRDQKPRATLRLRDAIGPRDGAPGSVIASPSRVEPNYYYHWVRDAALVLREVYEMRAAEGDVADRLLKDYVDFSRRNQLTPNPTGTPEGLGLGEPKFEIDGRAYAEPWGRPQNDGPALRAYLMALYALDLWTEGHRDYVTKKLYRAELPATTLLKADLEYVAHHWTDPSFDLWEESLGDHFYTRMTQWRALEEGAKLARLLGDTNAAEFYEHQAAGVLQSLDRFWSPQDRILRVTLRPVGGIDYKNSGVDVAILLAVIQVGKDFGPFSITDERVMETALAIEKAFTPIYRVNRMTRTSTGEELAPAIGRYPEDRYDGYRTDRFGNPWFLATHALAEFYYRLAAATENDPTVVTDDHRPVLARLMKRSPRSEMTAASVSQRLVERGDAFLRRAQFHSAENGHQSEQFNRDDGTMQGARDLTWSYASFLSALRARSEVAPSSRR